MKEKSIDTSRRGFLRTAVATGAGSVVGLPALAQTSSEKIKYDETYDVVIVGSGFGGNSAALEAAEQGLKALLIEKMPAFGGNSSLNGGGMAVAGCKEQTKQGIKDSVDLMVHDLVVAGRGLTDPAVARAVAEGSEPTYRWALKHGANFNTDQVFHYGGHSVPRIMIGKNNTGSDINVPLRNAAMKAGTEYRANCVMDELILENGRVTGVLVRDRSVWNKPKSGVVRRIRALRGVIVASGGYAADVDFRKLQDPRLDERFEHTNQPGGSAQALKEMMRIGALPRQLSWIQTGPWCSPDEVGYGDSPDYMPYTSFVHGLSVDVRTGKRFMNELADRLERSNAIIKVAENPDGEPFYPITFCDSIGHADPGVNETRRRRIVANGVVKAFDTIEELAKHYGIPVKALKEQVEQYNEFVRKGKDSQFNKLLLNVKPVAKPPFYAQRLWIKVHYTMGGVAINEHAEVLNYSGKPIPGLFAVGEVASGYTGASRLGGCGTTDPLVMGRVAVRRIKNLK